MNTEQKYRTAAEAINKAGGTPLPITDTLIDILKVIIDEDEAEFIAFFMEQKSQTMEQLKQSSGLSEQDILDKTGTLAERGVIFDQPNRKGVVVYRLLPLINVGTFEYTFMKRLERSERDKQLAVLFTKLFEEVKDIVQANYDGVIESIDMWLPIDRTVPALEDTETGSKVMIEMNEGIEAPVDKIMPAQKVEEIIEKFDEIAVGHCFCRHHKDMVGKPCKQTDDRENCFTFGKSARYTSSHGFSRMVSREEAYAILKRAEKDGLIHKAYHPNFDTQKDETSICNCCKCCCGQSPHNLIGPTVNATNYLAQVIPEQCTGCGICEEVCHTEAIFINKSDIAEKVDRLCIGCGLCATHCPEDAIKLVEGERVVRIPPPRRAAG